MPKLAATDVVGAEFGDEPGVEPDLCVKLTSRSYSPMGLGGKAPPLKIGQKPTGRFLFFQQAPGQRVELVLHTAKLLAGEVEDLLTGACRPRVL